MENWQSKEGNVPNKGEKLQEAPRPKKKTEIQYYFQSDSTKIKTDVDNFPTQEHSHIPPGTDNSLWNLW